MIISNIEIIPGRKVVKHLGMVQGNTVRAKHAGRDIMAGFKNIFGGELKGYTELLQDLGRKPWHAWSSRRRRWVLTPY